MLAATANSVAAPVPLEEIGGRTVKLARWVRPAIGQKIERYPFGFRKRTMSNVRHGNMSGEIAQHPSQGGRVGQAARACAADKGFACRRACASHTRLRDLTAGRRDSC